MSTTDELVGKNSVKRLISPKFEIKEDKCLYISHTLNAESAFCALHIYQEEENTRSLLLVIGYNGDLRGVQKSAYATLPAKEWMGVSVELNCSSQAVSVRSQIYQMEVNAGTCEDICKYI